MALPMMQQTLNTNPPCTAKLWNMKPLAECQLHHCARDVHRGPWHLCACGTSFNLSMVVGPSKNMEA
jgi:hypothetical protein